MTEPGDADRSTAGDRIPIPGPDRDQSGGQVEDYQDLHNTFIGGAGNSHHVDQVTEEYEEYDDSDPPMASLIGVFLALAVAAVIAIMALTWWAAGQIR